MTPETSPEPDTVTEAVELLTQLGYTEELDIVSGGVGLRSEGSTEATSSAVVEHVYRFEGPSDPADEAIVLGVSCPTLGVRGIVVSGYGPEVDLEHVAVLQALTKERR